MMEKPLALSSYTQGGRGKPSSATSVTVWRVRCPLVVAPIQLWTSSTNRKSLATTMQSWRLYKQEPSRHVQKSAWHRTAPSGLSALVGTKCREVPRVPTSAETLRHGQSANTIARQVGKRYKQQKQTERHVTKRKNGPSHVLSPTYRTWNTCGGVPTRIQPIATSRSRNRPRYEC